MAVTATNPGFPLFSLFNIEQIHQMTGYSEAYLLDIKRGRTPPTPKFRRMCCAVLHHTDTALFGSDGRE